MGKTKLYINLLITSVLSVCFCFQSCENDNSTPTSKLEGHWVYKQAKVDVLLENSDPILEKQIADFLLDKKNFQISYEFKNDQTYSYYVNYKEPLKGVYSYKSGNTFLLDDQDGVKTLYLNDAFMYVITDAKQNIADVFEIDPSKLIKVTITEIYERGLISE